MIEISKKICDACGKEILNKKGEPGFSEWTVYHFKKRRDFCSMDCFARFVLEYLQSKIDIQVEAKIVERKNGD